MYKHILHISHKTMHTVLTVFAIVFVIFACIVGALAYRLSLGPMSLSFAQNYVRNALSDPEHDISVSFDDMVLTWPDYSKRMFLDLKGLHVAQGQGQEVNVLRVGEASVGLSRRALLIGLIRPMSVVIRHPELELVRSANGGMTISLSEAQHQTNTDANTDTSQQTTPFAEDVMGFISDMAHGRGGHLLSRMDEFVVEDGSLAIRDRQFGLSWYLTNLDFSLEKTFAGLSANLSIPLEGGAGKQGGISARLKYRKLTRDFVASATAKNVNPYFLSKFLPYSDFLAGQDLFFNGALSARMGEDFTVHQIAFDANVPSGVISLPEQFDKPLVLKNLKIASRFESKSDSIHVPELSGEISGIPFKGTVQAQPTPEGGLKFPVKVSVPALTSAQIESVFPKSEYDSDAYEWVVKRVKNADFKNVILDMILAANKTQDEQNPWVFDLAKFNLNFDFANGDATYQDTLMPAQNASGKGALDLVSEVLEISDAEAMIGDVQATNVSVKVTDLMKAGAGFVTINGHLNGPVSTALSYIASEPIHMGAKEIGIEAKTAKGTLDADLTVAMPTLKDVPKEDVDVKIKGTLSDLDIPAVVEGLPLSGGPLALETLPGGFGIKGEAKLAGRDVTLDWLQYFEAKGHPFSMKLLAKITADEELRTHFGVDLADYISGALPLDLIYTSYGAGNADIDITGDIAPLQIHIDPLGYEKPPGEHGTLKAKAILKNFNLSRVENVSVDSETLKASKATIEFAAINGKKADLIKGALPSVHIGNSKLAVNFALDKNNVMQVNASGAVFDLAPMLKDSKPSVDEAAPKEKQKAMNISLKADKLLLKNGEEGKTPAIFIKTDTDGDVNQMQFSSRIGKNILSVVFMPDVTTGKRTFRLSTMDAGSVLNAFDLYNNVRGGTLDIYGEPKDGKKNGDLYGTMRMENFRVVKAPALAKLLSLMSLQGVSGVLENKGLMFSKLESQFEWRFRKSGNVLVIKDGKTSGSAIGLTFAGYLDRGKNYTDVSGTIIPLTEVNAILAKIPLVGDLLLGGSGGLIAATYSMKGPSDNPSIMVNPLSVLAPGFLRRLLFEGGYENKIPGDEDNKTTAPVPIQKQSSVGHSASQDYN